MLTGQFYVLYLVAVTKFADMGAYLTGSAIGRHLMFLTSAPKKTGKVSSARWFALFCSLALFKLMPGHCPRLPDECDNTWMLLGFAAVSVIW